MNWNQVYYPLRPSDPLPPERKVVLVWCGVHTESSHLPYVGYVRYAAGCQDSPYFVVYHGNSARPIDVVAWCDCLPDTGPEWASTTAMYDAQQRTGRGFPARGVTVEELLEDSELV